MTLRSTLQSWLGCGEGGKRAKLACGCVGAVLRSEHGPPRGSWAAAGRDRCPALRHPLHHMRPRRLRS